MNNKKRKKLNSNANANIELSQFQFFPFILKKIKKNGKLFQGRKKKEGVISALEIANERTVIVR